MSSHRRHALPRRRAVRRRRRTVAERGARLGLLLTALLATGAVGAMAMSPEDGRPDSRTAADDIDSPSTEWLNTFDALHDELRDRGITKRRDHQQHTDTKTSVELPARSGTGRRVVFDMSGQRVWMVGADGRVRSTYLVSGSRSDNLRPGRYKVFSRSRNAVGYGGHSTMEYFVRFARGKNSNIGFHDIPVDQSGKPVQSRDELGTPQSAGCIRQKQSDAKRMWRFADAGTKVVVVA